MVVKAPGVGEKAFTLASILSELSFQLIFKSSFEILGAKVAILLSCSINSEEWFIPVSYTHLTLPTTPYV